MGLHTKITIISENTAGHHEGLLAEHGFAAFIEKNEHRILFDTGQGGVLVNNSAKLGIDLGSIDSLVLSHGHWDHVGGIPDLIEINKKRLKIFAHPDVFAERYYTKNDALRHAGIRSSRLYLESFGVQFEMNTGPKEVVEGMWLTGEVPRKTSFEKAAPQLKIRINDELVADDVIDEQSIVIPCKQGLLIMMGCGHPGMINIIDYAIQITGRTDIAAVIGGTHLMFQSDEQIEEAIKALKKYDIKLIGTSHCTGGKANSRIRAELGDRFMECNVGTVLEFD